MTEPTYEITLISAKLKPVEQIGRVLLEFTINITGTLNNLTEAQELSIIIDQEKDQIAKVDYDNLDKIKFLEYASITYPEITQTKNYIKELLLDKFDDSIYETVVLSEKISI